MPRELVRAPGHDRARSLGWLALKWMEHFCVHGPGDVEGEPVLHDDELAGFVVDCYALNQVGRRLYDSAFFSRPKGRDKSGTAARFGLFEGWGPCRFAGFAEGGEVYRWRDFAYRYVRGEPMGQPVRAPFVRCLATEEGQTGNVYDAVYYNLTEGPLADVPGLDAGLTRTYLPGGRPGSWEIRPSTASSSAKDGGRETFVVFDETHLYRLAELVNMYATVRRNLAKRKAAEPWSLETSTMYAPGEGSVAEATHALAKLIRQGKLRSAARLLFDHRRAPDGVDEDSEAAVRLAFREAYGDFAQVMDMDRLVTEFYDPRNDRQDSRRYFFNLAVPLAGKFLDDPRQWPACADAGAVVPDGTPIALGFDGSLRRDATALRGCTRGGHLFTIGIWERPLDSQGRPVAEWKVPELEVDAAVDAAHHRFQVVRGYYDPAWWGSWVATWAGRHGDDKVVEFWTNQEARIARELKTIKTAIANREVTNDGDPVAARHWANAHKRQTRMKDENGQAMYVMCKDEPNSPRKIDAAMADTLAVAARNDALAAGLFNTDPPPATARSQVTVERAGLWRPTQRLEL